MSLITVVNTGAGRPRTQTQTRWSSSVVANRSPSNETAMTGRE